ncbi:glycosyltransferase [Pseudoneobacillus sp. C159]
MNFLYVSSLCSRKQFKRIYENAHIKIAQQSQKYHILMAEGFSRNSNANITVLSARPISRNVSKRLFWKQENEIENNISFSYLAFINIPILRQFLIFICSFYQTMIWSMKNKKGAIICDVLNISVSYGAFLAAKLMNRKITGIVTDVPGFFSEDEQEGRNVSFFQSLSRKINMTLITSLDSYILLTKLMNNIVNPKGKPYCVIEGQVDNNMTHSNNNLANKYTAKVCVFAGSLNRANGINILVDGFIKAGIEGSELHIYGSGDYEEELTRIAQKVNNVLYYGSVHNDIIIQEQIKATLLINPRPTDKEFTKYSFPSKNMEYMVSGTPTLTTKLPGMPMEYYEHVYLINDETVDGVCLALKEILTIPIEQLHNKGLEAKKFVLREKNNIMQANKIIEMLSRKNKGVQQ